MKEVIDSNIFISSLDPKDIFHSECYPIFEKVLSSEIEPLCPAIILVETICVIRRRTNSESIAMAVYKNLQRIPSISWLKKNKGVRSWQGVRECGFFNRIKGKGIVICK